MLRVRGVAVVVVVVTLLGFAGVAGAQTITGFETRVTSAPGDQYDPAISKNVVVYTDDRSGDTDVYYVDLATMLEHRVIVAPGNQELTTVSNGRVVYTDYRSYDVVMFDIATGVTTNLTAADKTAAGFDSIDPAISGSLVAWEDDRDGNPEIYAKNVDTGEERRITFAPEVDERPAISGSMIVWERCPITGGNCDIWSYDWASGATTQVTNTPDGDERHPTVDGRKVVYQAARDGLQDVYVYDLDSRIEKRLPLPGDQANPHISGDFVSFDDLATGIYHIGLWHVPSNSVLWLTGGTSGQYLNAIDGNRVVYTDDRNGDLDIYMYTFEFTPAPTTDTLPPVISGAADVTVDATSASGAHVTTNVTATDDVDPSPVLVCSPRLDSLFPIGATPVTCTATDASGNSSSVTFAVHVRGATDQLGTLSTLVASLNIKRGIENSLDAKLNAAQAALDAARAGAKATACNVLVAFVNEVNAQTGKAITAADAAALLALAQQIRAVLGCS